jgi:hypothetical protein
MRRKVLQYIANMFPQRFIDLPEGGDLGVFARHAQGAASFDLLAGTACIHGVDKPELVTPRTYRAWLLRELERHRIDEAMLRSVVLSVDFTVTRIRVRDLGVDRIGEACFAFDCVCTVVTDTRAYTCVRMGEKEWGYLLPGATG